MPSSGTRRLDKKKTNLIVKQLALDLRTKILKKILKTYIIIHMLLLSARLLFLPVPNEQISSEFHRDAL